LFLFAMFVAALYLFANLAEVRLFQARSSQPVDSGIAPALGAEAAWSPLHMRVGQRVGLTMRIDDVRVALPAGTHLAVGFPHYYYALRSELPGSPYPPRPPGADEIEARQGGLLLPTEVRSAQIGHWYVHMKLPRSLEPGASLSLELRNFLAPNGAVSDFMPLVLVDPAGGEDFQVLPSSTPIKVSAAPASRLAVIAPSQVAPGEVLGFRVCAQDQYGNTRTELGREVRVTVRRDAAEQSVQQTAALQPPLDDVCGRFQVVAPGAPGFLVLEVEAVATGSVLRGRSNPVLVEAGDGFQVVWADLHGHSARSDGRGSPAQWYRYARDVSLLDVAALTDHDWMLTEAEFEEILDATEAAARPGSFVTIPAFESNIIGDEIALYGDTQRLRSLGAGTSAGPKTLWQEVDFGPAGARPPDALGRLTAYGSDSLIVGSHTMLSPAMGTAYPLSRPVPAYGYVELYSAHGSSECRSCEYSIHRPPKADDPGRPPGVDKGVGSAREALSSLGPIAFIATSDSHDGRPGNSRWGSRSGGLTALRVQELTRAGVLDALQQRRTWATTGQRTWVDFEVAGQPAGSILPATTGALLMRFRVRGPAALAEVRVLSEGEVLHSVLRPASGQWVELPESEQGDSSWYYLKALFEDGAMAWSSPIFVAE